MPIWYNNNICNYFNKDRFDKGIIYVNDLFINDTSISLDNLQGLRDKMQFFGIRNIKTKDLASKYTY